jgi:hypothetical protein
MSRNLPCGVAAVIMIWRSQYRECDAVPKKGKKAAKIAAISLFHHPLSAFLGSVK